MATTFTPEQIKHYAMSYPVAQGGPVTQGHADYCEQFGHSTWVIDGVNQGVCPRCNTVTQPAAAHTTITIELGNKTLTWVSTILAAITSVMSAIDADASVSMKRVEL